MRVLPTSGASTHAASASDPQPAMVQITRCRTGRRTGAAAVASACAGNGYHQQMAGARMVGDVGLDAVELADVRRGQRLGREAVSENPTAFQQDNGVAQRRGG